MTFEPSQAPEILRRDGDDTMGVLMESQAQVPQGIDAERPSAARVYDFLLGGAHNFGPDRHVAERLLAVDPGAPRTAHENRAFLRRAVEYLVGAGVRQFLDIGSGIPTVGHVHEIAQRAAADARVVYVDIDPIAVAHSRHILGDNRGTAVIQEDFRRPEQILDHPDVRRLLDFEQPVAVLLVALLHLISDTDDPTRVLARLTQHVPSGTYLVLSHLTEEGTATVTTGKDIFRHAGIELTPRTRRQIEAFFSGWDLLEPGLVWAPQWHPERPEDVGEEPGSTGIYAGVARKP